MIGRSFRGVTGDVEDWIVRNLDESAASVRQPLDSGLATLELLIHEVELAMLGEQVCEGAEDTEKVGDAVIGAGYRGFERGAVAYGDPQP